MDANGGESLESLRIFGFMLWFFLKHLSLMLMHPCLFLCMVAQIHYINPRKRDCHKLPKWGRLKEHGSPCVVLVINDNPYGLMVALSYTCRVCP